MARMIRENKFKGYVQTNRNDLDRISEITKRAVGSGSISKFAEACGVNKSTISRIINKKISGPIAEHLLAKIAINAEPSSGVTIEELLDANGMVKIDEDAVDPTDVLSYIVSEETLGEIDAQSSRAMARRITAYAKALYKASAKKMSVQETIQNKLLSLGKTVAVDDNKVAILGQEFSCEASFVLKTDALQSEKASRWAFLMLEETGNKAAFGLNHYFGLMFLNNPRDTETKVTVITSDKATYQAVKLMYGNARIPASFSVMLMDPEKKEVENEFVFDRSDGVIPVRLFPDGGEVDLQELYGVPEDEM